MNVGLDTFRDAGAFGSANADVADAAAPSANMVEDKLAGFRPAVFIQSAFGEDSEDNVGDGASALGGRDKKTLSPVWSDFGKEPCRFKCNSS